MRYRYYKESIKEALWGLSGEDEDDTTDLIYYLVRKSGRAYNLSIIQFFYDFIDRAERGSIDISVFHDPEEISNWFCVEGNSKVTLFEELHDLVDNGVIELSSGNKTLVHTSAYEVPVRNIRTVRAPRFPDVSGFTNDAGIETAVKSRLRSTGTYIFSSEFDQLLSFIMDRRDSVGTFYYHEDLIGGSFRMSTMTPSKMAEWIDDAVEELEGK